MADVRKDPSMDDILASIKRIIAEDSPTTPAPRPSGRGKPSLRAVEMLPLIESDYDSSGVLELTDTVANDAESFLPEDVAFTRLEDDETGPEEFVLPEYEPDLPAVPIHRFKASHSADAKPVDEAPKATPQQDEPEPPLVSEAAATASRHALSALTARLSAPQVEQPGETSLEGLVREMLRPVLKEWLDAHLPALVEKLVEKEIQRIAGGN